MKKKLLLLAAFALTALLLGACEKPGPVDPDPPTPPSTEIDVTNLAPGGFSDDGLSPWDE